MMMIIIITIIIIVIIVIILTRLNLQSDQPKGSKLCRGHLLTLKDLCTNLSFYLVFLDRFISTSSYDTNKILIKIFFHSDHSYEKPMCSSWEKLFAMKLINCCLHLQTHRTMPCHLHHTMPYHLHHSVPLHQTVTYHLQTHADRLKIGKRCKRAKMLSAQDDNCDDGSK